MDVVSPPYPLPGTTPKNLHRQLHDLYDWTRDQIEWANNYAVRVGHVPETEEAVKLGLPPRHSAESYYEVSVCSMYNAWNTMRSIRERHDELIRNFEDPDAWDNEPCNNYRFQLVRSASILLSVACLDDEKRQAKAEEILREHTRKHLSQWGLTLVSPATDNNESETDAEADDLWYGSQTEPDKETKDEEDPDPC